MNVTDKDLNRAPMLFRCPIRTRETLEKLLNEYYQIIGKNKALSEILEVI